MAWTPDEAVTRLFIVHYQALVRLAALILREDGTAEEIVQDAYVRLHSHWHRLRDPDKGLVYLRTAVVNGCRSALRHRVVADRHVRAEAERAEAHGAQLGGLAASAEAATIERLAAQDLIGAVRTLPTRQREALVLRYYADLSEAEIAETMGCSRGAVKSHLSRGLAALRSRVVEDSRAPTSRAPRATADRARSPRKGRSR